MASDAERIMAGEPVSNGSTNSVNKAPKAFNMWVENNRERAKGWASMPNFVRDNPQYVDNFEVNTYGKAEKKFTRVRRTKKAMQFSLSKFLKEKYPNIPNTEKAAIYHYTQGDGAAFRHLNKAFRRNTPLTEFQQAFSELLSLGLSRLEAVKFVSYRVIRVNKTTLNRMLDEAKNKNVTRYNGYTSTSACLEDALAFIKKFPNKKNNETDVLLRIKGKSGRYIEDFSEYNGKIKGKPNQHEILFDKGLNVRYSNVELKNGLYEFYLDEITY